MNSLKLTLISQRILTALLPSVMLASCGGGGSSSGSPTGLSTDRERLSASAMIRNQAKYLAGVSK
jgi:hypothetical protein